MAEDRKKKRGRKKPTPTRKTTSTRKDRAGNRLPGGKSQNLASLRGMSAGAGTAQPGYQEIPAGLATALRTGRYGGVKLSRGTIEALRAQYSGMESQELQVQPIRWGTRRSSGYPESGWGGPGTIRVRPETEEPDLYEADAVMERFVDMARNNPEEFVKYQKQLLARRFYSEDYYKMKGRKNVSFGVLDRDAIQAISGAIGMAQTTGDLDEVLWKPLTPEQKAALFSDITAKKKGAAGNQPLDEVDIETAMMEVEKRFRKWSVPVSEPTLRKWAERLLKSKQASQQSQMQPEEEEVPGVQFG